MQRISIVLLSGLFAAGLAGAAPDDASPQATRATMGEIFQALAAVLPASLDEQRFSDPARRAQIQAALTQLAAAGGKLEAHGQTRDASFGFLSRSLARDTAEIERRFADGRSEEARFLLHELTQDCVACHSRLPSQRDASLGRRLMSEENVAALPLDERAELEFATRQFESAQKTLEALLASPDYSASDLDLTGSLDEYLELCLRVRQDHERAARTLERFAARPDVPERLRIRVGHWITSLREIAVRKPAATPLAQAQALLAVAQDRARFPDGRDALVYELAASGELHRFADATPPGPDVAYAYFLLGQIEARVGRSLWLSQTDVYLEASIRMAPGAPFAPQALAELRDFLVSSHTGSGGRQVPVDVQKRLAELSDLIERSRPPASAPPAASRQVEPPTTR
jgi:hypothetical protein